MPPCSSKGMVITIVVVYVDDIILTGDVASIQGLKSRLHKTFSIKDLGILHYFLGIEVTYTPTGIILTQKKFIKDLLDFSGISDHKRVVTPLPLNLKLTANEGLLYPNPTYYRNLGGKLDFLTHTRSDLAYTVQHLNQFMKSPRMPHYEALQYSLKYITSTASQVILLHATYQLTLQAFSDSDWASCPNNRHSITRYILLFGQSPGLSNY